MTGIMDMKDFGEFKCGQKGKGIAVKDTQGKLMRDSAQEGDLVRPPHGQPPARCGYWALEMWLVQLRK